MSFGGAEAGYTDNPFCDAMALAWPPRQREERVVRRSSKGDGGSDEAIETTRVTLDCFASLA